MNSRMLTAQELEFLHSLYTNHKRPIYTYIWHLTEHSPDTEDIVSEVFLIACEKCSRLMSHPNPVGFLYITARNKVAEYKRHFKKDTVLMNRISERIPATESYVMETGGYGSFSGNRIPEILDPGEYMLFKSRYIEKLSAKEIAKRDGISEASVYTRISRLKAKLNSKAKD